MNVLRNTRRHLNVGHRNCQHFVYAMNCAEMDNLCSWSNDRCRICGRSAAQNAHRWLSIDHAATRGDWAVRGLVCSSCNGRLRETPMYIWRPEVEQYMALAWVDYYFGERCHQQPEPSIGKSAHAAGYIWTRAEFGWWPHIEPNRTRSARVMTWDGLNRQYGPPRIEIIKTLLGLAIPPALRIGIQRKVENVWASDLIVQAAKALGVYEAGRAAGEERERLRKADWARRSQQITVDGCDYS